MNAKLSREQIETMLSYSREMESWVPATPNPDSPPVVLIEPNELEALCLMALGQTADEPYIPVVNSPNANIPQNADAFALIVLSWAECTGGHTSLEYFHRLLSLLCFCDVAPKNIPEAMRTCKPPLAAHPAEGAEALLVPVETIERAIAALQRHLDKHAPMRVPVDDTDSDIVKADLHYILEAARKHVWRNDGL